MTPTPDRTPDWQPIETAPKDGTHVLLGWAVGVGLVLSGYWPDWRGRKAWVTCVGQYQGSAAPTHWMPLPPPPGERP